MFQTSQRTKLSTNILCSKKLEWKTCRFPVSNSLLNHRMIQFRVNFIRDKNSSKTRNISFLNINRKYPTLLIRETKNAKRNSASDCENKVVWKPQRGRIRGWPQVQADKKLPLTRVASRRVRATEMCPLLSSFLPFVFSPVSASAKCLLAPFIPNQIPDPLV